MTGEGDMIILGGLTLDPSSQQDSASGPFVFTYSRPVTRGSRSEDSTMSVVQPLCQETSRILSLTNHTHEDSGFRPLFLSLRDPFTVLRGLVSTSLDP